jgi:hypothetical protein
MPIARGPEVGGNWRDGAVIREPVPEPLVYLLDPDYPGTPKPLYKECAIPVMRDDVADALRQGGVDNIQYFRAILRDPKSGREYSDYKAFNIVGVIACADMGTSELMGTSDSAMIDVDFSGLVIDESKTGGALLFRLGESVSAIVVHEKVKDSIEQRAIPGFVFYGPGEWSG